MKIMSLCCHIYKTFQLSTDDNFYTYANWLFEQSALSCPHIILLSNVYMRLPPPSIYNYTTRYIEILIDRKSDDGLDQLKVLCHFLVYVILLLSYVSTSPTPYPHTDQLLFIFTQLYWNIDRWIVWICFSNILHSRDWRMRWE